MPAHNKINRNALTRFINIILSDQDGTSSAFYKQLLRYVSQVDKELGETMQACIYLVNGRVFLKEPVAVEESEDNQELFLRPAETAQMSREAIGALANLQELFYLRDGEVVLDDPVGGSDCVDAASRLLAAFDLAPVTRNESDPLPWE